jgi:glycosyltransferase involved in cell wall biosynthesis
MKSGVTVCIPTYNSGKFVLEALQSVVDQTRAADEIIVSDNHSEDNTVELIENFKEENNIQQLHININPMNIGYRKNFIKCYELASRKYFLILHSDDLLKPYALERLYDFMETHLELALVGGKAETVRFDGQVFSDTTYNESRIFEKGDFYRFTKMTHSYIPFSSVLFKKEFINEVGYLQEDAAGPDDIYWPEVLKKYPIGLLAEVIIQFGYKSAGQEHQKNFLDLKRLIKFYDYKMDKLLALIDDKRKHKEVRSILRNNIANLCVTAGTGVGQNHGKYGLSLVYFNIALKYNPNIIFTKRYTKNFVKILLRRSNKF